MKTRLAQDIGNERAAEIYSAMAKTIINQVAESSECETIIFFDPPERKADVENWLQSNGHKLLPQEGSSLGERMLNAFRMAFSLGADKAVIIGTDCVKISDEMIREAFGKLETIDVVLGPADDGGYYLLGLKRAIPEIFDGIEWSTSLVLDQTVKKLREKGLEFQLLQTLKDVDTVNDIDDELLKAIGYRAED